MSDRDNLIEEKFRELTGSLCVCRKLSPSSSWPHTGGRIRTTSKEEAERHAYYGTETDSRGRVTYTIPKLIHLRGCPMGLATAGAIRNLMKPVAEEIVDLKLQLREAEAKVIGAKRASRTHVGFDHIFLYIPETYFNRAEPELLESILPTLAEALGARILTGRGWETHDDFWKLSKPIVEKSEKAVGGEVYETHANLTGSSYHADRFAVFPTRQRAEAFVKVGRMFRKVLLATYESGKSRGASLLHELAADNITLKELEKSLTPKQESE